MDDYEQDILLLQGVKKRDIKAFLDLYRKYSEDLLIVAYGLLGDPELSAKAVDELFYGLWERGGEEDRSKPKGTDSPVYRFLYATLHDICHSSK